MARPKGNKRTTHTNKVILEAKAKKIFFSMESSKLLEQNDNRVTLDKLSGETAEELIPQLIVLGYSDQELNRLKDRLSVLANALRKREILTLVGLNDVHGVKLLRAAGKKFSTSDIFVVAGRPDFHAIFKEDVEMDFGDRKLLQAAAAEVEDEQSLDFLMTFGDPKIFLRKLFVGAYRRGDVDVFKMAFRRFVLEVDDDRSRYELIYNIYYDWEKIDLVQVITDDAHQGRIEIMKYLFNKGVALSRLDMSFMIVYAMKLFINLYRVTFFPLKEHRDRNALAEEIAPEYVESLDSSKRILHAVFESFGKGEEKDLWHLLSKTELTDYIKETAEEELIVSVYNHVLSVNNSTTLKVLISLVEPPVVPYRDGMSILGVRLQDNETTRALAWSIYKVERPRVHLMKAFENTLIRYNIFAVFLYMNKYCETKVPIERFYPFLGMDRFYKPFEWLAKFKDSPIEEIDGGMDEDLKKEIAGIREVQRAKAKENLTFYVTGRYDDEDEYDDDENEEDQSETPEAIAAFQESDSASDPVSHNDDEDSVTQRWTPSSTSSPRSDSLAEEASRAEEAVLSVPPTSRKAWNRNCLRDDIVAQQPVIPVPEPVVPEPVTPVQEVVVVQPVVSVQPVAPVQEVVVVPQVTVPQPVAPAPQPVVVIETQPSKDNLRTSVSSVDTTESECSDEDPDMYKSGLFQMITMTHSKREMMDLCRRLMAHIGKMK